MPERTNDQTLPPELSQPLIAIAVGNTRTRFGTFEGRELRHAASLAADESLEDLIEAVRAHEGAAGHAPLVALASVAPERASTIERAFKAAGLEAPIQIGRDLPLTLRHTLDESGERTVGQDRLLNALAAHRTTGQACVVVDAGTAVTVDFIDGEGVFQGGLIAPGLNMMLRAMHQQTESLPEVEFELPGEEPAFAPNTPDAMRLGVATMLRGVVRVAAERYAIAYDAYPPIVATGGDAGVLEADGIVESFVPDLQLIGIRLAAEIAAADFDDLDAEQGG